MEPKIRLKGFRDEWNHVTIGDVATIIGGGTPSTSNPKFWGGSILWFTPTEVGHNKYVKESERTITQEGLEGSSAKIIPANSILLSSRATIGEASINTCSCSTNQGFQSLVPINTDLEFLYSLILTKKGELIKESNGSTFLEISGNKVRSIKISIPEINEQQIIGSYFQHLDSLIQATAKKIESLKQVKDASLQSMFPQEGETVPRVRFKGFDGEWQKTNIGNCGIWSKGRLLSKDDICRKGLFKCIHYGELFTIYGEVISDVKSKTNLKDGCLSDIGDILFPDSDVTPSGLARCSSIMESGVVLGGGINILKPKKSIFSPFLSYSINVEKGQIISRVTGTTVRHINAKALSEVIVSIPNDYREQEMIANFFISLDNEIVLYSQRLEKLQQIKSACLDNMFV